MGTKTPKPKLDTRGRRITPAKYPVQLVIMVAQETGDRIELTADALQISKSEAARAFILAGIEARDHE